MRVDYPRVQNTDSNDKDSEYRIVEVFEFQDNRIRTVLIHWNKGSLTSPERHNN